MKNLENNYSLVRRLFIYQKERFPLMGHGAMIAAFTFSAISYSRICRGVTGFIGMQDFLLGLFNGLAFFLLLRICDEFKDKEDDAKYRAYLPVPRGLVSLSELRVLGLVVGGLQLIMIALFQAQMIGLYLLVMAYLFLMTKEFFVHEWLKARQMIYAVSHMMIVPLIDLYSSGLDWKLEGAGMHIGLLWFIIVSFFNGLVLEIGRKIRTKEQEEEGVMSYTKLYGTRRAVGIWVGLLTTTLVTAFIAIQTSGQGYYSMILLAIFFLAGLIPALAFLKQPTAKGSKQIEVAAGLWTIMMYLTLGAIPMINNLIV